MVSMNDIAKKLNLSRTTVSNILNNKPESLTYKSDTVNLVKETAKEMGYIPNNMARAINTGVTMTLAILVPELSNTYYIEIISIVEKLSTDLGYRLLIFTSENSVKKENEIIEFLMRQRIDGLMIAPVSYSESLKIDNMPFEVVCFDRKTKDKKFLSVTIDNKKYTENLIEDNIEQAYDKVVYMGGSCDDITVTERLDATHKTLEKYKMTVNDIYFDVFENEESYNTLKKNKLESEKDILFVLSSSYFSLGVVKYFKEIGFHNYKILAFEKFYSMDILDADINVVDQPIKEIAELSFKLLMNLISGKKEQSVIL